MARLNQVLKDTTLFAVSLCIWASLFEFVALRTVDPLGAWHYHNDLSILFENTSPHQERGFVQEPGEYHLSHSTVHVTTEGRIVPNTNPSADCVIAAVGDSVTFGHGVEDEETWVNLLAREFPQARFINLGVNGYTIENVRATLETTEADGYIYLIVYNDADPPFSWSPAWATSWRPGSGAEVYYVRIRDALTGDDGSAPAPNMETFGLHLQAILSHNVKTFAADDGREADAYVAHAFPDVSLLSPPDSLNSWADQHPDAFGHRQVANQMIPLLSPWVAETCSR